MKERVTLPCGCGCGKDIRPRTRRQLERDLAQSLSGNLFFNKNHFGRWSYRNQKHLRVEREIQEFWDGIPSIHYENGKKIRSMGNLLDLIDIPDDTPLGGHTAPTNSNFKVKGMADKNEQVNPLEERKNELLAEVAKLQSQIDGTPAKPMTLTEATTQNLGNSRAVGGNAVAKFINEKYPNNLIVSRCYNPAIQVSPDLIGRVWINSPENILTDTDGNPVTALPLCRAELGIWTIIGNAPTRRNPYNTDEENGEYVRQIPDPDSEYADPHCFYCPVPIRDGIMDRDNRPRHWQTGTGTMTERQIAWRWQTYDGPQANPGPGKQTFANMSMDEYVEHIKATYPLSGNVASPIQTPVVEREPEVIIEANDDSDLPPSLQG